MGPAPIAVTGLRSPRPRRTRTPGRRNSVHVPLLASSALGTLVWRSPAQVKTPIGAGVIASLRGSSRDRANWRLGAFRRCQRPRGETRWPIPRPAARTLGVTSRARSTGGEASCRDQRRTSRAPIRAGSSARRSSSRRDDRAHRAHRARRACVARRFPVERADSMLFTGPRTKRFMTATRAA